MTLTDIKNSIYRRTGTDSQSFPDADMVIAINNANERVHTLIRKYLDNFRPTPWTTADLSTGTATPKFDANYHDLIPLWVDYQNAVDKGQRSKASMLLAEIEAKERELQLFYGARNYSVFTVTIASPGVLTCPSHRLATNDRVTLVTTGALPTGLSVDTFYYVIAIDDDTFELAATKNGSAITTTGTQSGTHYVASEKSKRIIPAHHSTR